MSDFKPEDWMTLDLPVWEEIERQARRNDEFSAGLLCVRAQLQQLEADQLDQAESMRCVVDTLVRRLEALEGGATGAAGSSYKTRSENSGPDRLRDGTDCRGEKCGTSRLNRHQVRLARRLYQNKRVSMRFLAMLWDVDPKTVSLAARGKNWA